MESSEFLLHLVFRYMIALFLGEYPRENSWIPKVYLWQFHFPILSLCFFFIWNWNTERVQCWVARTHTNEKRNRPQFTESIVSEEYNPWIIDLIHEAMYHIRLSSLEKSYDWKLNLEHFHLNKLSLHDVTYICWILNETILQMFYFYVP